MVVGQVLRDLSPEAFLEADVRYMRHTWNFQDPYLAEINPPGTERQLSLWMVQRSIFDNALAQRAARAGADLRDELPVQSIENAGDRVTVRCKGFEGIAKCVIGADGANGITARFANLRQKRAIAIAQEVEYPHRWGGGHCDLRPDVIHLEYGAVKHGYAWIFPKSDHLNVGAGLFRPRGSDEDGSTRVRDRIQSAIIGYLELMEVPFDRDELKFHAHPLPVWNGREPLSTPDGRILLAGDAAGLVNPVFGDGILQAIKSGLIAAECAANGASLTYTEAIHREFAPNFDAAQRLASFFYQWTGTVYKYAIKRPNATHTAARLLCGDALFTHVAGRAVKRLRRNIAPGHAANEV